MSWIWAGLKKAFGKARQPQDPIRALGLDIWRYEWLHQRIDAIVEGLKVSGNYVEACDKLDALIRTVCEPWYRSDRELAQKVAAWDQLHKILKSTYLTLKEAGKVSEEEYVGRDESGKIVDRIRVLKGEAAEHVNRFALDVFKTGLHLLTLAWKEKDVGPVNVYLIQKLYPELVPPIRPTAEAKRPSQRGPLPKELEQ